MTRSIILIAFLLAGCGGQDTVMEKPVPQTPPAPPPIGGGGGETGYAQMSGFMVQYCNQCHSTAAFMQSERGLRSSSTLARLTNKSMPTANARTPLPDNVRVRMINFF